MTAAEILRNAEPPVDDGVIDQAISELDSKIWEWAEALKTAHTQLRSAFAVQASAQAASARAPEAAAVSSSLKEAAAAAHVPSPPPMPAEWIAKPGDPAGVPAEAEAKARGASDAGMPAEWSGSGAAVHGGHGASAQSPSGPQPDAWKGKDAGGEASTGVVPWPTEDPAWSPPGAGASKPGPQEWPTWTPTDTSKPAEPVRKATASDARTARATKPSRPAPVAPSPEERAQKAAAEEALLSELEDAIARRVRLLRRLDPDTPIEKLVEKAKQGQVDSSAAPPPKQESASSATSWWRRK